MFVARRLSPKSQKVELWDCEWENREGMQARKIFVRKVGEEQPLPALAAASRTRLAICWAYGRTLDNIAVLSPALRGHFSGSSGGDALLPCDFVNAGKYRNGAERWWCRMHQTHWGTKADQASYSRSRAMVCSNHEQRMQYVVKPLEVDTNKQAELAIWCALPPALSNQEIEPRPPKIRVSLTGKGTERDAVVHEVEAMSLVYSRKQGLFSSKDITRVNVTPPAAFEFMHAMEFGRELTCVGCSHCKYPHLDLGDFARKPHRKHSCANCGRDSTWTREPIVSTPLKPLHDHLLQHTGAEESLQSLNLDDFEGCDYSVWASTPAIVWTAKRPQTIGIRVRVTRHEKLLVEDTFGAVLLRGKPLDRRRLLAASLKRTTV